MVKICSQLREADCMFRALTICVFLSAAMANATDWSQYRGPNHDGSTPDAIATTWQKEGPKVVWKAPIGDSFGSFAVSGGKAFIFIERKGEEVCIAIDSTGKEVWATTIDKTIFEGEGGNGPRS